MQIKILTYSLYLALSNQCLEFIILSLEPRYLMKKSKFNLAFFIFILKNKIFGSKLLIFGSFTKITLVVETLFFMDVYLISRFF